MTLKIKKYAFLIIYPLIAFFMLTSCKEAVKPEEAGILFVNQLIFEEDKDLFTANFTDGEALSKEIGQQKKTLVSNIVTDINQFGGVISSQQTETMVEKWLEKMMTATQFQLKSVKELNQRQFEVFFTVTGLDFIQAYQVMTDELVGKMLNNPEIAANNYKLGDSMVASMTDAIDNIRQSKAAATVSLTVEKKGSQWEINPTEREEKVTQLLLAFLSGHESADSLAVEMQKAVQKSMAEGQTMIREDYEEQKEETSGSVSKNKTGTSTSKNEKTPGEVTIETEETYDMTNDSFD